MARVKPVLAPAPAPAVHLDTRVVPVTTLHPNGWNVNRMEPREYEAARESIRLHGFVDPVTVRLHPTLPNEWEILDGEHRWKAAQDEGLAEISINILPLANDALAQRLSLILNQHGTPDRVALAKLLATLQQHLGADLGTGLAYSAADLAELVALAGVTWDAFDTPKPTHDDTTGWATISVRAPPPAAQRIERALARARTAKDVHAYRALLRLADHYLRTHSEEAP